jgi:multiple antibiotic resistance protein
MPFFAAAFSLFFVLNALGNIPLFVGILAPFNERKQRKIICRELLIGLAILLLFNFFGDVIMSLLGISHSVLGVAGGTLLFLIAISMIFPKPQDGQDLKRSEPMIVPLATPLVAGPGAISAIMIYAQQFQNTWISSGILLAAFIPTFLILLLSSKIKRLIGDKGLLACQKLGGMLISLIAIQMICSGLTSLLKDALK